MSLESVGAGPDGFRAALGTFASSVNVITMWDDDGKPLGMTATAFSSVSADPQLVLVCINRSTRTYDHISKRGRFGINILGAVARDISDYCARAGADKYLDESWLVANSPVSVPGEAPTTNAPADAGWSSPALAGALGFLDCSVEQDIHAGTHAVLIGAVEGIGLSKFAREHEPLVYFQGSYRPLQAKVEYRRPQSLPILMDDFLLEHR
jgi:flavin reductase (DIM6/NTAB) family NADH-FMN oxidoreductase RutF